MALDARRRSSIFQKLIPLIGDDDANALMSEFPSVEADELVTKQFLRAELAELRTEMATLASGLRGDMASLEGGLRGEIADLRAEMVGADSSLRGDMASLERGLRGEMADLRTEMVERFRQQTIVMVGLVGSAVAVLGTMMQLG